MILWERLRSPSYYLIQHFPRPNEGVTITKGVMHRPRAPKKTVMVMVETSEIIPTGN
jgi:hypothetical protein